MGAVRAREDLTVTGKETAMNTEPNDQNGNERSEDWQWFGDNSDRCHHVRLATAAEIVHLQEYQWLDVSRLADGCFVYAVSCRLYSLCCRRKATWTRPRAGRLGTTRRTWWAGSERNERHQPPSQPPRDQGCGRSQVRASWRGAAAAA
jgi:hypothetical protein